MRSIGAYKIACLRQIRTVTDHLETNDGKVLNEDQIEDLKEVTKARKEQDVNLLIQLGVGWLLKILTYYLDRAVVRAYIGQVGPGPR